MAPDAGHVLEGLVNEHALTRTVRDCAALLDATAGPAPGDPTPPRLRRAVAGARSSATRAALRIRWNAEAPFDGHARIPRCARRSRLRRPAASRASATSSPRRRPTSTPSRCVDAVAMLHQVSNLELYALAESALGRPPERDELEPTAWEMLEEGRSVTGEQLLRARSPPSTPRAGASPRASPDADAFLVPTLLSAGPPPLAHLNQPRGSTQEFFRVEFATTGWTAMANVSGFAAISLPLRETSDGLPLGHPADGAAGDRAASARRAARARRRAEVRPQPAGERLGGHARRKPVGAGLAGSGLAGRSAAGVSAL